MLEDGAKQTAKVVSERFTNLFSINLLFASISLLSYKKLNVVAIIFFKTYLLLEICTYKLNF